jgi:hypothetical protein
MRYGNVAAVVPPNLASLWWRMDLGRAGLSQANLEGMGYDLTDLCGCL